MRSLLLFVLLAAIACAQKANFDKKVTTLITTYLGANEPKATDLVCNYLVNQSTWEQITDGIMNNALSLVPSTKYLSAMGMLTTFSSCLDNAGSSLSEAVSVLSAAFKKILTAPYTTIANKMKNMTLAGKATAEKTTQAYTIATAALTKDLVQKMINAAKAASTPATWNCAMNPLNTVMLTSQYNMTWSKSG